jgi:hypothetical protein
MTLHCKTVSTISIVTLATVGMFFAPEARACGVPPGPGLSPLGLLLPLQQLQTPRSLSDAQLASPTGEAREDGSGPQRTSLVGMWTVNFYVAGQLWDVAIEQFYGDGNEMTNDIAVSPTVGNVCWGVWERVSDRVYKMKHIGWGFDTTGAYAGRFDFVGTLEVGKDGDTFSGKFVADQEDLSGNLIPALHAEGFLKADRFKLH